MKNLLIVDDDSLIANIWKNKFEAAGYEVCLREDAESAIEYLKTSTPGTILLDLGLPRASGISVLRFIRGDERLKGLPVVVISASTYLSRNVRAAWDEGATHFIRKGDFSVFKLVEIINRRMNLDTEDLPAAPAGKQSKHLLLAENHYTYDILDFFLTSEKFKISSVSNGQEAIDIAESDPPDILILDADEPEMCGSQLMDWWTSHPTLKDIPIIVTATADDEEKMAWLVSQMASNDRIAFLSKPIRPDELMGLISHYTSNQ